MTLTCKTLKEALEYNSIKGVFTWRVDRPVSHFPNSHQRNAWIARYGGLNAGSVDYHGYESINLMGIKYLSHRLAWLYEYGSVPKEEIDHINGEKLDNSIKNLRQVCRSENNKNKAMYKSNTSGIVGVCWCKRSKLWVASITINSKRIHLGCYKDIDKAKVKRMEAEKEYKFHKNHGRAA